MGEGRSLSSKLGQSKVREPLREASLESPIEQLYPRLQEVVRALYRPTHLLTFRKPSVYQMIHDRFGRRRRYPTACHASPLQTMRSLRSMNALKLTSVSAVYKR